MNDNRKQIIKTAACNKQFAAMAGKVLRLYYNSWIIKL